MDGEVSSPGTIPIMVVQDNGLLREGILTILRRHADLDIVAVAEDAATALARLSDRETKVVLVDAGIGDRDSHDVVADIAKAVPEARVIVMDVLPEAGELIDFVKRGASGFLVKETSIDTVVHTIRAVARGAEVLPEALTQALFSDVADQAITRSGQAGDLDSRLTPRELEVIALIAESLSNKAIGGRLGISIHTVKSHVRNIMDKLELHTRLKVAAYFHQAHESDEQPDLAEPPVRPRPQEVE